MAKSAKGSEKSNLIQTLSQQNFLFRDLESGWLAGYLEPASLIQEKLYSSRPIFTAFRPNTSLDFLYAIVAGGPVIVRSTPLDRIVAMTYPGSCFGMRNLPIGCGPACRAFPSLVEAYKTTDVVKIPRETIEALYNDSEVFRERYRLLFELREKFQYHLLNCSTYPPQAVAALLRALIYQERALGNQLNTEDCYIFDLPVDIIAHACQLNHRTVEQVLKGMTRIGILKPQKSAEGQGDWLYVVNSEELKEVYSSTRDKVAWWPLR